MESIIGVVIGLECALIWFAIKSYVDNVDLKRENERLEEKITELKEWLRNSK